MRKLTINEVELHNRRVFLRVEFNVPLTEQGEVREDTRIRANLPTIRLAAERGAKVILASHMGRPKGVDPKLSLRPIANRLSELLGKEVPLAPSAVGPEVEALVAAMQPGDIILLENVRFHPGETKNDPELAAGYARFSDLYVNDAFGSAHRAHSSNVGIARLIQPAVAGLLLAEEIDYFTRGLLAPERPLVAILGGSKVSTKIGVIEALLDKVDKIIIGGGMAFTFFRAQGLEVGNSLVEEEMIPVARRALEQAAAKGVELLLPEDCVIAPQLAAAQPTRVVGVNEIPVGWMGLDIGPRSCERFAAAVGQARTIVWNGPPGVFEMEPFAAGTIALARAVADSPAVSIAGGGDTDAALRLAGVAERVSYISTGGGAFLEWMEGKELPGIAILNDA